ncbi:MAG: twin transmembrane helix small protein [Azospirillum sp.]|nr:twin transmembrane helix small protein [Azospirillum sp.]
MPNIFVVLMILAMLAVLGTLVVGIVSMVRGGEFNAKYANKLMCLRVSLQGVAIALFTLSALTTHS